MKITNTYEFGSDDIKSNQINFVNEFNENDKLLIGFFFSEDDIITTKDSLFIQHKKFKFSKIKNLE